MALQFDEVIYIKLQVKINYNGFIFADRAYVVNVNHVKRLKGNIIYMDNGEEIEVSRVQSIQVKEKIAEYWRLLK